MKIIVTGGSGFIGHHLIKRLLMYGHTVANIDKLTDVSDRSFRPSDTTYEFYRYDINDAHDIRELFYGFKPNAVFNLAALSHVDTSIKNMDECFKTNIDGLQNMLKISKQYFDILPMDCKDNFRFIQVSTDEVYGSLNSTDPPFTEESNYKPNTPYSASKAAGDMLARCYQKTYGLPVIITHCSNNFGTHQHPEKFIPKCVYRFINNKPISIFGSGEQVRDWIHVNDHVDGLLKAYERGIVGESYLFGSGIGYTNNFVAQTILDIVSTIVEIDHDYAHITHSGDRNHDFRYAVDCAKTKEKLGWEPRLGFLTAIDHTVKWYCENKQWLNDRISQK